MKRNRTYRRARYGTIVRDFERGRQLSKIIYKGDNNEVREY